MNTNLDATGHSQTSQEREVERALRPKGFDSFAGQQQVLDNICRCRQAARRAAGSCASAWASGSWKDHVVAYYSQRTGGEYQDDLRAGAGQAGRFGRDADFVGG